MIGLIPAAYEADELQNHDKWARRRFRETEAIHHLSGLQPMKIFDGTLRDVRQNCVSAAECYDGGFAEEDSLLKNRVVSSQKRSCQDHWCPPNKKPDAGDSERASNR